MGHMSQIDLRSGTGMCRMGRTYMLVLKEQMIHISKGYPETVGRQDRSLPYTYAFTEGTDSTHIYETCTTAQHLHCRKVAYIDGFTEWNTQCNN